MKTKQTDIVLLTLKLDKIRPQLTEQLKTTPITDIAKLHNLAPVTLKKVLLSMGFQVGRQQKPTGKLFNDVVIVLARVCKELNVNHEEIKKYLDNPQA